MMRSTPSVIRLVILSAVSVALMGADTYVTAFKSLRTQLDVMVLPVHHMIDLSVQGVKIHLEEQGVLAQNQTQLTRQLKKLQKKNLRLLVENQKKRGLESENQELKLLLNSAKIVKEKLILARLLEVSLNPSAHYIIVDKGKSDGIVENQPILDAYGVMGLATSVSDDSSKVRLITDKLHAVPVQNSRNGLRGIVSGTGKLDQLILLHVPLSADYKEGDLLLTSGLGGRYPGGYPIGTVTKVERAKGQAFSKIIVSPAADLEKANQVMIVTGKIIETAVPAPISLPESASIPEASADMNADAALNSTSLPDNTPVFVPAPVSEAGAEPVFVPTPTSEFRPMTGEVDNVSE